MDTINLGRPCRITIDAGHGGDDSGAEANGLVEKELNLPIGLRLAALLRAQGHTVFLTRQGDESVSLGERAHMSVANRSELFVSIHHDDQGSSGNGGCHGFAHRVTYRNGMDLATKMAEQVEAVTGVGFSYGEPASDWFGNNLGVFANWNNADEVTCGLVECLTLSRAADAAKTHMDGYTEKTAQAFLRGIHQHLGLPAPDAEPQFRLVGIDGKARTGAWLGDDGHGYCALAVTAEAAGCDIAWDGKGTWTLKKKA